MSFIGKLHEISLYGLVTCIMCLILKKLNMEVLWEAAFNPNGFYMFFLSFLFWASVLFIPIAITGAFATRYYDDGEGLTFDSKNIVVIMFAHIGEELLGLFLTPFWFLKDFFTKNFNGWKIFDYVTYLIELIFIGTGLYTIL